MKMCYKELAMYSKVKQGLPQIYQSKGTMCLKYYKIYIFNTRPASYFKTNNKVKIHNMFKILTMKI